MSNDRSLPREDDEEAAPDAPDTTTEARNAFVVILTKLGRRDHTEKELQRALLKKAYSQEAIDLAIAKAKREGLVNDERLAGVVARMNARLGKRGPRKVVAALRQKGISAETATLATKDAFAESDETETNLVRFATRLLRRARGATAKDRKIKVLRSLLARGFEMTEVRRAVAIAQTTLLSENTADELPNADE